MQENASGSQESDNQEIVTEQPAKAESSDAGLQKNTVPERTLLDRMSDSLAENVLVKQVFLTPNGIFISEQLFPEFIKFFQVWLKNDSGAEGILPEDRCLKIIFEKGPDYAFYLLDGKSCHVGKLIAAKPKNELKNKFRIYPGTPMDGRKMIHPKDPFLTRLPTGVSLLAGASGMELTIKSDKIKAVFKLDSLPELLTIFKGSPRLRRFKQHFQLALRDMIPEFCRLILSAQPADRNKLRMMPARFRNNNNFNCLRLSDTYLIFDRDFRYLQSFGLKGKNLFDFVNSELETMLRSLRNRRVNNFEIEVRNRRLAGTLRLQNEKFQVSVHSLLEWIQTCRTKGRSSPTLFDFIAELSQDFSESGWVIERDISNRYKNFCKRNLPRNTQLNYRTSRQYLFAVDKKYEIVAIVRWVKPKPVAIQLKPITPKNVN